MKTVKSSLHHCITASLHHCITASLHHCITASLLIATFATSGCATLDDNEMNMLGKLTAIKLAEKGVTPTQMAVGAAALGVGAKLYENSKATAQQPNTKATQNTKGKTQR